MRRRKLKERNRGNIIIYAIKFANIEVITHIIIIRVTATLMHHTNRSSSTTCVFKIKHAYINLAIGTIFQIKEI